jgi:hypothetical protein
MRHFFHFIFFNVKQPEESHEDTPTRVGNLEDCQLADLSSLPLRIASESLEMCFYDVNEMQCCCWKWGHFRQHCAKEYRTGETCGMKLVMNRYQLPEKCKICTKIDTKERMMRKGEERIRRWQKEGMGSMGKNRNDSQLLGGEPRVTEQEWRLWESADTQADQLKNAWHDVEKMKDELESLLEERVRKRYQREITESDDSDLEGSPPPSTTIEGQFTSLLDSPGGVSSTNVSGFAHETERESRRTKQKFVACISIFPDRCIKRRNFDLLLAREGTAEDQTFALRQSGYKSLDNSTETGHKYGRLHTCGPNSNKQSSA